jgi:hypothetical protein
MIIALTSHLRFNGHTNVKADIEGYTQPEPITGGKAGVRHIPDVTSTSGSDFIFEVETADSIDEPQTAAKWHVIAADSQKHEKRFIVVVPQGSDMLARRRARELGVAVNDVWTVR